MKRNYDEASVIRSLSKNPGIGKITPAIGGNIGSIEVIKDNTSVGNGTWGKIDFLTKHCNYVVLHVDLNAVAEAKLLAKQAKVEAKRLARQEAKEAKQLNLVKAVKTNLHKVKFNK